MRRLQLVTPSDDAIIDLIIAHEGSTYTNDPTDAGGPTKYGITLAVLTAWRHHPCTAEDVKALTRDEAVAIYRSLYISPFGSLPASTLRTNAIDMGVNAGVRRSIMLLQQTIGAGVDGWIGDEVRRLVAERDWNVLYTGVRLAFYEDLIVAKPSQIKYRRGWRARALSFVEARALQSKPRMVAAGIYGHMGKAA